MNTPYVADAHDGFRAGQSKQTLFSGFARSFFRTLFFSTESMYTGRLIAGGSREELSTEAMQQCCWLQLLLSHS
jgi:hypothetical protein